MLEGRSVREIETLIENPNILRIHEVCPELVFLVLDTVILELELDLTVLEFICNFVDPTHSLEYLEKSVDMTRVRHRRDSDLEMVTEHVSAFDKPCPIFFITQSTNVGLENLPMPSISHVQSFTNVGLENLSMLSLSIE